MVVLAARRHTGGTSLRASQRRRQPDRFLAALEPGSRTIHEAADLLGRLCALRRWRTGCAWSAPATPNRNSGSPAFVRATPGQALELDPSFAPEWLPQQNDDMTHPTGKHTPQWVQKFVEIVVK